MEHDHLLAGKWAVRDCGLRIPCGDDDDALLPLAPLLLLLVAVLLLLLLLLFVAVVVVAPATVPGRRASQTSHLSAVSLL